MVSADQRDVTMNAKGAFLVVCLVTFLVSVVAAESAAPTASGWTNVKCDAEYRSVQALVRTSKLHNKNQILSKILGIAEQNKEKCPNHVGVQVLLAYLHMAVGENLRALAYASNAVRLAPNDPEALHVNGLVLSVEGDSEESLRLLKRSVDLDRNNLTFLVNYCSTLELFAKYKKAVEVCSRAIDMPNSPPIVLYIRHRAYAALGHKADAQRDLEKYKSQVSGKESEQGYLSY